MRGTPKKKCFSKSNKFRSLNDFYYCKTNGQSSYKNHYQNSNLFEINNTIVLSAGAAKVTVVQSVVAINVVLSDEITKVCVENCPQKIFEPLSVDIVH